jgi:anti-sigma factor RsiW
MNKASNNTLAPNQSTDVMNMYQRDRFELLSAYIDGEVTAAERKQIEQWLTTDPEVQCLYARVLELRPLWSTMPAPTAQLPMKRTIEQVSPSLRKAKMTTVAGTVLATVLLGSLSAILPPDRQSSVLRITQAPQSAAKNDFNACFKYPLCKNSQINQTGIRKIY